MKNKRFRDSSMFAILILAAYSVMPAIGRARSQKR
jgi:hypothetical protein